MHALVPSTALNAKRAHSLVGGHAPFGETLGVRCCLELLSDVVVVGKALRANAGSEEDYSILLAVFSTLSLPELPVVVVTLEWCQVLPSVRCGYCSGA